MCGWDGNCVTEQRFNNLLGYMVDVTLVIQQSC